MSVVSTRLSTASVTSRRDSLLPTPKPKFSRQLQQPHVTLVEYKTTRFLITDQPSATNMKNFILTCQLHQVRVLVRVCESTYDETPLEDAGIRVLDLEFQDGAHPPDAIIDAWFQLITDVWQNQPDGCIAVHCKGGLGRAPVLVAIVLIELGMPNAEAIDMIRNLRQGALNTNQIQFLMQLRSHKRLRLKGTTDKCWIL